MAQTVGKLTALKVVRKRAGMHPDGAGLYLQVTSNGARSWIFRYRMRGDVSRNGKPRSREMGLGPVRDVSLAEARDEATKWRRVKGEGRDPISVRKNELAQRALANGGMTFKDATEAYIKSHRSEWSSEKHAAQWEKTLQTYAYPVFGDMGDMPAHLVDDALVLKVLRPLWSTNPATAGRLRGRIESVLNQIEIRKRRQGENPARWHGHLKTELPSPSKVRKVVHLVALPYDGIGSFMSNLRASEGVAARALEFTILTAARSGEVLGAKWDEFDLQKRIWTTPAIRMKKRKVHQKPLSARAVEIIEGMGKKRQEFVFPGAKHGRMLSENALLRVLRTMSRDGVTVHGFRSTFRDWAGDKTTFPREVAEVSLAHSLGDESERAYRRGDAIEKRRKLMDAWAAACAAPPEGDASSDNVVNIGRQHGAA